MKYLKKTITNFLIYAFLSLITGIGVGCALVVSYFAEVLGASGSDANLIGIFVTVIAVLILSFEKSFDEVKDDIRIDFQADFSKRCKELEQQSEVEAECLREDRQAFDAKSKLEAARLLKEWQTFKTNSDLEWQKIRARAITLNNFEDELKSREQDLTSFENKLNNLLNSTEQTYPWLAQEVADFKYVIDQETADALRFKKRPAIRAADEVKAIAREKRMLTVKCKEMEYQLNYYETLFPWLEEFKELPPAIGAEYAQINQPDTKDEYESLRNFLSPEEYSRLSTADKYQLALDRYKKRQKSDWEVGIEYERYVGYFYESHGYSVNFHGALMGKLDMGRDLIASKDDRTLVIQCKRWAKSKTIHEKHIFQLYGSAVQMAVVENKECIPVFITTSKLSYTARKCAEYLHVLVRENFDYSDYPIIKCNVSRDGEKIYHLPFDQQYDRVKITPETGETYVATVAEAEALGFRRAYRWHGSDY